MSKKSWPEDDKPIDFEQLSAPLVRAVRFAYKLQRQNTDKDIPWSGPEIGKDCAATCLPPKTALSAKNLAYSNDEQGRDALTEIIGLAIQMGIEQGRRITMDGPVIGLMKIEAMVGRIKLDAMEADRDA